MKFCVDFVTNSSSDSTVMVFIKRKDGQYIVEEGDTSPFEEGRLEIRNGKLYADDEQIRTVDQLLDCLGFFSDLDGVKKLKDIAEIGLMDVEQEYGESISNRYSYQLEKAHPGEFEEDCQNGVTSHVVKKWEGYLAALFGDKILNLNEGDIEGALESEDMDLMFPECIYVKGYPMDTLDFSTLQEAGKKRAGAKLKPPQQAALKQSDLKALFADVIWERGVDYTRKRAVRNLIQDKTKIEADVMGSKSYHVCIVLRANAVSQMTCTCPYAGDGLNCKHMAAVLCTACMNKADF